MDVENIVNILQEVKALHPSLTNQEVLKIVELKVLMEASVRNR